MSTPVFDTTIPLGLTGGGFKKSPRFNNLRQKTASGKMTILSLMPYAGWDFEVDIPFFDNTVLNAFLGVYLESCAGEFLFTDPQDSTVTGGIMLNVTPGAATPMGQKGDGTSTKFQLARSIGQGVDILQDVAVTNLKVNGTIVTGSVDNKGVVTFDAPPGADRTLSWSGTFKYRVQFTEDTIKDLAAVSKNAGGFLWTVSSVSFSTTF